MKRYVFALLFVATAAHAQTPPDLAYFCTPQVTAGLYYNAPQKKWVGVPFKPPTPFVLRLKFQSTKKEKIYTFSQEEPVNYYTATMTEQGTSSPGTCRGQDRVFESPVKIVSDDRTFDCTLNITDYRFNLKSNRFLAAYIVGYVDGTDSNADNPSVTAGICTKIE
jgi:hypothetical protein